jgi:hypothetical protein
MASQINVARDFASFARRLLPGPDHLQDAVWLTPPREAGRQTRLPATHRRGVEGPFLGDDLFADQPGHASIVTPVTVRRRRRLSSLPTRGKNRMPVNLRFGLLGCAPPSGRMKHHARTTRMKETERARRYGTAPSLFVRLPRGDGPPRSACGPYFGKQKGLPL